MATKKIEVADLRLAYGAREALKGVTFDVYQNEILAVIGPAQSGKTSLLKALNRTLEFIRQREASRGRSRWTAKTPAASRACTNCGARSGWSRRCP